MLYLEKNLEAKLLNYKTYGEGTPIYFIHGNCLSLESMSYIYEPLFKMHRYKRIYVDLPGMGDSEANYNLDSSSKIIESLSTLIDELTPDEKFYLVGHSYGGYLSLGINNIRNNDAIGVFLTCPVVYAESDSRKVEKHKSFIQEDFRAEDSLFDDYLDMNVMINKDTWKMYQQTIKPGIEQCDMKYNEFLNRDAGKYYKLDNEHELYKISNKGTIILGKYDHIVGYQDQIKETMNSNFEIHLLDNAGHNLMIDDTTFLYSIARRFFDL